MKKTAVVLRCDDCEAVLAIAEGDNKKAIERAMKDILNSVCPKCGVYLTTESIEMLMILPGAAEDLIQKARAAGMLYE